MRCLDRSLDFAAQSVTFDARHQHITDDEVYRVLLQSGQCRVAIGHGNNLIIVFKNIIQIGTKCVVILNNHQMFPMQRIFQADFVLPDSRQSCLKLQPMSNGFGHSWPLMPDMGAQRR